MAKLTKDAYPLMIPKENVIGLVTGLSHDEFKCKCSYDSCTFTLIDKALGRAYHELRVDFDKPLTINSGYRCQRHNASEGGSPTSSHSTGHAIDISFKGMSEQDSACLIHKAKQYFDYVQVYEAAEFIHCHILG